MDLDAVTDMVRKHLDRDAALISISNIDDPDPTQRTIGIETEDGALFFLTIQEP